MYFIEVAKIDFVRIYSDAAVGKGEYPGKQ